jgi:general stress protein 26
MNKESDESVENLSQDAAVKKIREIAKSARVCLFGTSPGTLPLTVRPMAVQEVDDEGNFWFLSGLSSLKNSHISSDPRVQLLFVNVGNSEYLSLTGIATISSSHALREKYWSSLAKAWFQGGVGDPELTVIKVRPEGGHYWDTEHGKAVTMLMIATAAVTGESGHIGVQGEVHP